MKGNKMGQHHPKQDKDYVSKVDPAVVTAFLNTYGKPPTASKTAYRQTISRHPDGWSGGKREPIPVTIGQDMQLAPTTYGFADRGAVDNWLEQALDSPT